MSVLGLIQGSGDPQEVRLWCAFPGVGAQRMGFFPNWEYVPLAGAGSISEYVESVCECPTPNIILDIRRPVREQLSARHLEYGLIYPAIECKYDYMERYRAEKMSESLISVFEELWDELIGELLLEQNISIQLQRGVMIEHIREVLE